MAHSDTSIQRGYEFVYSCISDNMTRTWHRVPMWYISHLMRLVGVDHLKNKENRK